MKCKFFDLDLLLIGEHDVPEYANHWQINHEVFQPFAASLVKTDPPVALSYVARTYKRSELRPDCFVQLR